MPDRGRTNTKPSNKGDRPISPYSSLLAFRLILDVRNCGNQPCISFNYPYHLGKLTSSSSANSCLGLHQCLYAFLSAGPLSELWTIILVSKDCQNKVPQTRWLRTEICLTILDARSPKSRCQWGHAPSETWREKILPCLF